MVASPDPAGGPGSVRSVTRALEILSLLNEEHMVVTLRQLQDETGLARTTLIRLLSTLEDHGLLWGVGTSRYAPGPGLLRWARLAGHAWELPADSRRALRELVTVTRETASIWVRQGTRRVCVAQEETPRALRHVVRVGREAPLWLAATSRVLVRDLSTDELLKIAGQAPDPEQRLGLLRQWQAQVKRDGHAVSHGEREDGLSVVAVPLVGRHHTVMAALTVAGPTGRFDDAQVTGFLAALRTAAASISASGFMTLGDVPGAAGSVPARSVRPD